MTEAPHPADESSRLAALLRFEALDTPAEAYFDELTELASQVCGTRSAVITFIDTGRQWFKSRVDFDAEETPRAIAFCAHTILQREVMVVPDALEDPRFADNPLVTGPPGIRFYAGVPLVTLDGHAVGSLAVLDYTPRQLDAAQRQALRTLGHQVVAQLELRRRLSEDRRVLQDRAEHTEAEKRALVESAMDCVVEIDHLGQVTEFNPAAERTFGHVRAAVLGKEMADLIVPPAQREAHRRGLRHFLATGEGPLLNRRMETTALRSDGTEFPVELTIVRLRDSSPPAFAGFLRDITERKERELELRRSTERFQLVARAINDAVWDWDLEANTTWWSEGLRTLFAYTPDELERGREGWSQRLHTDDLERVQQSLRDVLLSDRDYWSSEYRFLRRDGTYAEVLDRAYVLRTDGKPTRMLGAMMDITEQKRAHHLIRLSEQRYRELVDGIRDAIFTVSKEGAITSANQASEAMLGWPRNAKLGEHFLSLVQPGDQALARQRFELVLAGEKPPAFELRLNTSSGATVVLEFTISPQRSGDRIIGILGVARDITDRHRLEAQVRQAQKMEALGHLSGGVAHDFNNLLMVIQCNAMMMSEVALADEIQERVREILEASERAAGLTRQLLLVSRKQTMRPTVVDLNTVVGDMTKLLRRILGEDITMRTACAIDLPLVRADVGMLEQVLLNLAVNARDAMPGGGALTIETSATTLLEDARSAQGVDLSPGNYVSVRVTDTGGGIAADVVPHIFEPFFTTKDVGKGTGLGLATVYAIVRQHHGWIEVTSDVGRGTTFLFHLPSSEPTAAQPATAPTSLVARLPHGTETILVVEDETAVRLLVVNMLEHCGYTVLSASAGAEALEVWHRHRDRVRLVVTDLIMPGGLNGRELAARLRVEAPRLPIVYTSGYSADLAGQGEPLVEGVNFLPKPYSPSKLAVLVRTRLDEVADRP